MRETLLNLTTMMMDSVHCAAAALTREKKRIFTAAAVNRCKCFFC